jgi:hypothetical protein
MNKVTILVALLVALFVTSITRPAKAQAAKSPHSENAAKLHKQATSAYKGGQYKQAIELWRIAEKLHPYWKYSYNLANALYEDGAYSDAWGACNRAEKSGMPEKYVVHLLENRAKIKAALFKKYALITLEVIPQNAQVQINGAPWQRPLARWIKTASSAVTITQNGFHPLNFEWEHAVGRQYTKKVRLKRARILTQKVPKPTQKVTKDAPIIISDASAAGSVLPVMKWVSLGVGAAAAVAGAVLMATVDASSLEKLNDRPLDGGGDFEQYSNEYDHLRESYDNRRMLGAILTGVGGAFVVTGAVLFVLDRGDYTKSDSALLRPLIVPGGGGLLGEVRF